MKARRLIPAHAGKTGIDRTTHPRRPAHPRSRGENDQLRQVGLAHQGSSPLTRGKPQHVPGDRLSDGLIPAHAGKTLEGGSHIAGIGAHPRSRGENIQTCVQVAADLGSSPLTRGKPLIGAKGTPSVGLIPAHAGKTPILVFYRFQAEGSSPLTRGKPSETVRQGIRRRLIPAHAGKTSLFDVEGAEDMAHPRSRGENRPRRLPRPCRSGSSPLTRGKPRRRYRPSEHRGLIPAHAGKTLGAALRRLRGGAHPRSRGENWVNVEGSTAPAGSSPLTRGKRGFVGGHAGGRGLIPAHAGKTTGACHSSRWPRAHPRSRGENRNASVQSTRTRGSSPLTRGKRRWPDRFGVFVGLIPAHAGKTRVVILRARQVRAHPRSRGENGLRETLLDHLQGSSPLTRGKPEPLLCA